jgi:uncharacterized BrkB/YihY/UPF0761 family membrane protein
MLAHLRVPLTWPELFKRTVKESLADDVLIWPLSRRTTFFFALFPASFFVIAVASFFPLQRLIDDVVGMLGQFARRRSSTSSRSDDVAVEAEQRRRSSRSGS